MSQESTFSAADKRQQAMVLFREIAGGDAPEPAHPEAVLKVRELWLRNRETISHDGASPAEWDQAVMRDTLAMLKSDPLLLELGLPDFDEEGVTRTLDTFYGIATN